MNYNKFIRNIIRKTKIVEELEMKINKKFDHYF